MSGRTAQAAASTPRSCTLPSSSGAPFLIGRLAATTSSGEASGRPCASRAMPGAWLMTVMLAWSSVDITSAADAPRMTIALSSLPVLRSVSR